jgi:biopolymer transport protein ExbD
VKVGGAVYWNGEVVDKAALASRMAAAAKLTPQPEVHLRADRTTEYEKVAEVMSAAAKAGLVKIGFITEPTRAP